MIITNIRINIEIRSRVKTHQCDIKFLLFFSPPAFGRDTFGIGEPFPENIYPIESTSVQVTCVAFDSSGIKTPEKIQFVRKDRYARYTILTANDNLYFTSRTEEVDKGKPMSYKNKS